MGTRYDCMYRGLTWRVRGALEAYMYKPSPTISGFVALLYHYSHLGANIAPICGQYISDILQRLDTDWARARGS